jgi:hypothetical protein
VPLPAHAAPSLGPSASPAERTAPAGVPPLNAPRTATLRLSGTDQGRIQARDFVERTLADWELDRCRADALTIVTELAAGAVRDTVADSPGDETAPEVWLKLTLRPAHLVCAVTDRSRSLPRYPLANGPLKEHGRGLHLVDALSEHWGWTRYAPTGKTVWAMLPTRSRT